MDKTDISAQDIEKLMLGVYRRYRYGEITYQKANNETNLLRNILKVIEVSDLDNKLKTIERLLKK